MSDAHILTVIGLVYLSIGLGACLRDGYLEAVVFDLGDSSALSWLFSFLAILMGFLLVTRDAGVGAWPVVITVIGWLALVKGVVFLAFPVPALRLFALLLDTKQVWQVAKWVILFGGALFLYAGYALF